MPLKKTVVYFYPQQKKYLINWAIPFSQKPKKQEGSQGSDGLPYSLFVRSGKSVKTFSVCQINPCGPNISTEHGTKKHFQNQNQHQIAILNSEPEGYFQFRIRTKLHFWDQNQNQMDVVYPPIDYLVKKNNDFCVQQFPCNDFMMRVVMRVVWKHASLMMRVQKSTLVLWIFNKEVK